MKIQLSNYKTYVIYIILQLLEQKYIYRYNKKIKKMLK